MTPPKSHTDFYCKEKLTLSEAKFEAQKLAFAPFAFQAALALRDRGLLQTIENAGESGIEIQELTEKVQLPEYGIKVLVEAGLGIGLLIVNEKKYSLTNLGYFVLHDPMTRVNMNFVQDVNYQGFFYLQESIQQGKPVGLKTLGNWPTLYEGLSKFPAKAKKSWFDFDHYYSDAAFPRVLPLIFKKNPKKILDVGGNTGKWALECLKFNSEVEITIADLPGQLRMAEKNIQSSEFASRVSYHALDLLHQDALLPQGHDVIWMSQFLDCFSKSEIISILKRAASVMRKNDQLFILETYWDRQKFEASAFCLQQISLYFACLANGNSQMYHSEDMRFCIDQAGLTIAEETDHLGISHTLFQCIKQ